MLSVCTHTVAAIWMMVPVPAACGTGLVGAIKGNVDRVL